MDPHVPESPTSENGVEVAIVNQKQLQIGEAKSQEAAEDKDEVVWRWGWFGLRWNFLQVFNSAPWLCAAISSYLFVQGMIVSGFVPSVLTTIEHRFELTSTSTGLIVAAYDVAVALFVLLVSYYGDYGNKPRILGTGGLVLGVGCLVWLLPQVTAPSYDYGSVDPGDSTCSSGTNDTVSCKGEEWTTLSNYFYVFIFAQFLIGVGASPFYTVGPSFVDESVTIKQSGIYLGTIYFFSVLGPACGFLLGGAFLTIYHDFFEADSVTITPQDPAWVGAWWLGFFLGMILIWCVALPMSGFPRELPGVKKIKAEKESETHNSDSQLLSKKPGFGMSFRDFPSAFLMLCKNPTYVCITVTGFTEGLLVGGFTYFMPKFVENQFGVTSALSSTLVGVAVVPGAAGGTFLGGWIIKKFNLNVQGMIKYSIVVAVMALILNPVFLLRCPKPPLAGVHVPYESNSDFSSVNLTHACNAGCDCGLDVYSPVCANNERVYFDPCHAGCKRYSEKDKKYYDCLCIPAANCTVDGAVQEFGCVSQAMCNSDCWTLPIFLTLFFLSMLFNFQLTVPGTAITLRCVPERQRSFAMGIQSVCLRLFGTIPGPIIVGAVIDSSCILWQESCGETGSCWVYDSYQFGLRFLILAVVYLSCTIVFLILSLVVYKPPPIPGKRDDEIETEIEGKDNLALAVNEDNGNKPGALLGVTKLRNGSNVSLTNMGREDSKVNLVDQEAAMGKTVAEKQE